MKSAMRALILLELFVCFAPVIFVWLLSLVALPFLTMAFLRSGTLDVLVLPAATVLGGLGLWGAFSLFADVDADEPVVARKRPWGYLLSGCIAAAMGIAMVGFASVYVWAVFTAPVLASVHFLYLLRREESD